MKIQHRSGIELCWACHHPPETHIVRTNEGVQGCGVPKGPRSACLCQQYRHTSWSREKELREMHIRIQSLLGKI